MFPSTAIAQDVSPSEPADTQAMENTYIDSFVQEGTPAPVGGRLIQLDPFSIEGPSYSMTKGGGYPFSGEMSVEDGVLDTAFVSFSRIAAVYRSDGSIEQFDDGGNWMPDVPAESDVLSMAGSSSFGSAFVVTGDGDLTTAYWEWQQILPEDPQDLGYSAVAAGDGLVYALRGNGEVVGFAKPVDRPRLKCLDHWVPAGGTRYTAISAAGGSWMALRSDGAVVTCGYAEGPDPYVGEVHAAPSGSTYVGVDAGRVYGLAASTTGAVMSFGSTSLVPPQPPDGSSVVGLSAGARTGAYILSDGSLTTWGKPLTMPDLPVGTDRFIAVSEDSWGSTYAIWAHEVLDLSIDVTVPESVRIGQPVNARVEVALDGVYRPNGKLCLVDYSESTDALCAFVVSDGVGTIRIETDESIASSIQGPGTRKFGFGFISPVGRFTYTTATFEVLPPAATQLTASVPANYAPGTEVTASFIVNVEDETVPAGEVLLRAVIGEDDDDLGYTDDDVNLGYVSVESTDPVVVDIDSNALPDGQYAIKAKYIPESRFYGWYAPTAPAQWRGTLTVGTNFVASRSPSISGTVQVGKTLTANRWTWAPTPTTVKYQWRLDGNAVSGATSKTWTVPASARGKRVTVAITGSKVGYATKTLVSPATEAVRAGVFVAPRPTITGTASVGSTLRVVRGTWSPQPTTVRYQWKVGGVAVRGATDYLFRVPASARGKRIVVTVTGLRAGYTTKTVTAEPTSVIR
ncbi:hypothetical protein GCM10017772_14140 [Promicromonospora soli]|uniref:Uncharacterized protein n=2 Tax=Promicromonospora soli TaxID=2035533 RepID=A0A919FN21_9MICO|nr:hypothetical protein GCM10017772_14140 [Promicromonospora soli]